MTKVERSVSKQITSSLAAVQRPGHRINISILLNDNSYNRPYSYSWYQTGTSLQWSEMNVVCIYKYYLYKLLHLSCKLVPFQWESGPLINPYHASSSYDASSTLKKTGKSGGVFAARPSYGAVLWKFQFIV